MEHLAVAHHEPRAHLTPAQRALRNRLRARGKQLGDRRNAQGRQETTRLVEQCAYEHWHRILFARFLAENEFLIEPSRGVAISLDDCRELAAEQRRPWIAVASEYAVRMLPQVFRADDPVLEVELPAERRAELETLLEELPVDVFTATDSLGWTYQFWQADAKDAVNASGEKIGAEELGPVTQLFTEDYMVDFLLHNTLGAWWAGKLGPIAAASEDEARAKASLPARDGLPILEWRYLRFMQSENGMWRPAAGMFDGWPTTAQEITVLDPCMGSGHFLVFALPLLARLRAEEEHLHAAEAVAVVLRDNLFGLELDERCTQIAAFNLALVAWRLAGYRVLPRLNLACSGLNISATENEWTALANGDLRLAGGMKRLYELFRQAPTLGSLVDPRAMWGEVFEAGFDELGPLLTRAVSSERGDENGHELAVTAQGVAKAAEILAGTFTLVVTNVPYLGRGKQDDVLKDYCERRYPKSKADLATCFVERCVAFCSESGSSAFVTPQSWHFLDTYKHLRKQLLTRVEWNAVARLGVRAFETIGGEVVNVALTTLTARAPAAATAFLGIDVSGADNPESKAASLRTIGVSMVSQAGQLANPDAILTFDTATSRGRLGQYAQCFQGISTGDSDRLVRRFWESPQPSSRWRPFQSPASGRASHSGKTSIVDWKTLDAGFESAAIRGGEAWGRRGVSIGQMSDLPASLFDGELFSNSTPVIIPTREDYLPAVWAFVSSSHFASEMRRLNPKVSVDNGYVGKVEFDLAYWEQRAHERYPDGLPKPHSNDPSQWLFAGQPRGSESPLHVAVARLVGFRWPRQSGSSFPECAALGDDGLEHHADVDGIVCLQALQREHPAPTRLRSLLADAFGSEWNGAKERELLTDTGAASDSLEEWLRDEFFEQHCALFGQRPFVWHIWDGRVDGFSALVNYHNLAGPDGGGRRTLDRLTHTYLGDWITRQRAAVSAREDGAEGRLAAAEHLKAQLERILEGESPYDLFVRWKPLYEQAIGWAPDINDGVRMNIRPFMTARPFSARGKNSCILRVTPRIKWNKDRGKEPERPREDFPWFWEWDGAALNFAGGRNFDRVRWNDLHYSRDRKQEAREAQAAREPGTAR
ncbi:MAG: hypothetical protein Q7S20_11775 [Gemmatimonadaceae bacterium]|nr:hypothetical protein [Gemmatimonadaceae bacterium]